MQTPRAPELNPALLPPGTLVGSWRVLAWAGGGVHGAVYQAVPVNMERAPPGALKLALLPRDPRFAREVELLSRVHHPSLPRLRDSGIWQHPGGTLHPFFVMDWVDGAPLYDWAQRHLPSSQQVLRLLAQLARALQALHAQGCLHRDVKGDNVLVRHSDNLALLTDLGSGRYPDASTLTPGTLPPGTPAYRSPEACLFELQFFRNPQAHYSAQPTDDLYSLGVTAYRLVTGEYPEFCEPFRDEAGTWHLEGLASAAPIVLNPRVDVQLNALILRMLSLRPEQRGTAEELAEALEQAAQRSNPDSTRSLFVQETPLSEAPVERAGPPSHTRSWPLHLAAAAALLPLLVLGTWLGRESPLTFPQPPPALTQEAEEVHLDDGGTAGLGDEAVPASSVVAPPLSTPGGQTEDTLPEVLPGQRRPDAKGRCARPQQTPLNGGCWIKTALAREECETLKGSMFQGTCYLPVPPHERQPTSRPVHNP
ncbi:serine/threonine-protein kinase [Stigmatella sp. ncwal1]|uniref:non-specific serine/threonine protein kinase n=1 Tax=Stigmatella ashevillensis TaxID=2995309 RepID=A0ABT5DKL5_9BACT|nr:serine/threonine-protein kinase [Stigmatella ashevillena]MDC0714158.1 serine/threonine-protein kinase [Stigmatella ashevillena]